ncbi:MAG: ABC transporter permease [Chthoniobacterales bacterium]
MIPIILGVMVITFVLFYMLQKPETMARHILGPKASPQAVENWIKLRGYDKPVFINTQTGHHWYDSQFCTYIVSLATFNLGVSDTTGQPVIDRFKEGAIPSLTITVPAFFLGLALALSISLFFVYVRETSIDFAGTIFAVALMSIPVMVYVIFGQWLLAVHFKYFPAYGFSLDGAGIVRFLALPVMILIFGGLGSDIRMYRAIFLEEIRNDYVRTAYAKGLSSGAVLLCHVLKNGMINIITLTVSALPMLILGSLVLETFFGIPGLGNMALDAIHTSDFAVIRATTYIGTLLYLFGLLLTDLCYAWVDPRIKLQ